MEAREIKEKRIGDTKYFILSNGIVLNKKTKRMLKPQNNGYGYHKVTLTIKGKQYQRYVHRLVAEAFIPNPLNKEQVNHINGIKSDNFLENLEWVSNSENQIHAHKTKLKANGKSLWNGKFSKEQIKEIFDLHFQGVKGNTIAKKMNCSKSTISDIINGKRYKYV